MKRADKHVLQQATPPCCWGKYKFAPMVVNCYGVNFKVCVLYVYVYVGVNHNISVGWVGIANYTIMLCGENFLIEKLSQIGKISNIGIYFLNLIKVSGCLKFWIGNWCDCVIFVKRDTYIISRKLISHQKWNVNCINASAQFNFHFEWKLEIDIRIPVIFVLPTETDAIFIKLKSCNLIERKSCGANNILYAEK